MLAVTAGSSRQACSPVTPVRSTPQLQQRPTVCHGSRRLLCCKRAPYSSVSGPISSSLRDPPCVTSGLDHAHRPAHGSAHTVKCTVLRAASRAPPPRAGRGTRVPPPITPTPAPARNLRPRPAPPPVGTHRLSTVYARPRNRGRADARTACRPAQLPPLRHASPISTAAQPAAGPCPTTGPPRRPYRRMGAAM